MELGRDLVIHDNTNKYLNFYHIFKKYASGELFMIFCLQQTVCGVNIIP